MDKQKIRKLAELLTDRTLTSEERSKKMRDASGDASPLKMLLLNNKIVMEAFTIDAEKLLTETIEDCKSEGKDPKQMLKVILEGLKREYIRNLIFVLGPSLTFIQALSFIYYMIRHGLDMPLCAMAAFIIFLSIKIYKKIIIKQKILKVRIKSVIKRLNIL